MTTSSDWKARPDGPDYSSNRQRLVDAAEAIVEESGAAALRLDSVGDRVGLHRSSVYRYFDSKEALLTAVVVQATLRIGRDIVDELGADAGPEAFLVEGLASAMARIAVDPVHRSLMAPSTSEAMTRVGSRALADGLRPLVEPLFVSAERDGMLRPGLTPDDALQWLLIVATGLFRAPDLVPDVDQLAHLLERLLVPALLDRPVTRPHR